MSVQRDPSGRRFVEMQVEVPGTPEDVWRAIATGPGMAAWFLPVDVEEQVGGTMNFHLAPGVDSKATVTDWDPPRRLAYEERGWSENAPPLATEVTVETRSGGTCVVRMVHSLFTSTADWDDQLESMESGWPGYFRVLRLYMKHFRTLACSPIPLTRPAGPSQSGAWDKLTSRLGFVGLVKGQRVRTPSHAPALAGVVEGVGGEGRWPEVLLRLDEPGPGVAIINAYEWGGAAHVSMNLYLYGATAAAIASRERPRWDAWMTEHFPSNATPIEVSPCP